MQSRMPILAAVIAGVVAILLMQMHISSVQQAARPEMERVMVAAADLKQGQVLEAKDVAMAVKAKGSLPALAIRWEERNLYLGQQLQFKVAQADYVLASYFGAVGQAATRLSDRIEAKDNQRAVTIPVTSLTSLEGSIRAGDRIDLLLTYSAVDAGPGANMQPKTVTSPLLDNVYVLVTGGFGSAAAPGGYSSLTLLVSSDEAKLLIWAMQQGELSILLRNSKDVQMTDRTYLRGDSSELTQLGVIETDPQKILNDRRPQGD